MKRKDHQIQMGILTHEDPDLHEIKDLLIDEVEDPHHEIHVDHLEDRHGGHHQAHEGRHLKIHPIEDHHDNTHVDPHHEIRVDHLEDRHQDNIHEDHHLDIHLAILHQNIKKYKNHHKEYHPLKPHLVIPGHITHNVLTDLHDKIHTNHQIVPHRSNHQIDLQIHHVQKPKYKKKQKERMISIPNRIMIFYQLKS